MGEKNLIGDLEAVGSSKHTHIRTTSTTPFALFLA